MSVRFITFVKEKYMTAVTRRQRGEKLKYLIIRFLICEMQHRYLKLNSGKLKVHTINPKATRKISTPNVKLIS